MTTLFRQATAASAAADATAAGAIPARPGFPLARVHVRQVQARLADGTPVDLTIDAQVHDPASAPEAMRLTSPQLAAWAMEAAQDAQAASLQALADSLAAGALQFDGLWKATIHATAAESRIAVEVRQAA